MFLLSCETAPAFESWAMSLRDRCVKKVYLEQETAARCNLQH